MTNAQALRNLCQAIASPFHPDSGAVTMALFNLDIDSEAEAQPNDANIFRAAALLVVGWVENSRSEGGVSVSHSADAVKNSLMVWANQYGIDLKDVVPGLFSSIKDCSNRW